MTPMSVRRLSRRALACTQRAVHPCATLALCHARQQALVVRPRLRGRARARITPPPAPAPAPAPAVPPRCARALSPAPGPTPRGGSVTSPSSRPALLFATRVPRRRHRPGAMATTFVHEGPSVPVRTKWTHEPRGSCRAGGRRTRDKPEWARLRRRRLRRGSGWRGEGT